MVQRPPNYFSPRLHLPNGGIWRSGSLQNDPVDAPHTLRAVWVKQGILNPEFPAPKRILRNHHCPTPGNWILWVAPWKLDKWSCKNDGFFSNLYIAFFFLGVHVNSQIIFGGVLPKMVGNMQLRQVSILKAYPTSMRNRSKCKAGEHLTAGHTMTSWDQNIHRGIIRTSEHQPWKNPQKKMPSHNNINKN